MITYRVSRYTRSAIDLVKITGTRSLTGERCFLSSSREDNSNFRFLTDDNAAIPLDFLSTTINTVKQRLPTFRRLA